MPNGGPRPGAGRLQVRFTLNEGRAWVLRRMAKKEHTSPQMILEILIDLAAAQLGETGQQPEETE